MALAVLGATASAPAFADNAPGFYIGGNVGRTYSDFDNDRINSTLAGQGFRINSSSEDKRDTGYKLFGGYQLNRNFAIEGGYFDLGKFNYNFTTFPAGSFSAENRVRGLNLDLVGIVPLGDRFSVFGRVGAAYAQSRTNAVRNNNLLGNFDTRNNNTNVKVGLGAEYAFTPALSVRGEVERYRVSDPVRNKGYIDMASIGLVYRFGGPVQRPVVQTTYVPVASPPPPPPPPPVVVAPPPPPPPPPPVAAPAPPPPPPAYVPPPRATRQDRN